MNEKQINELLYQTLETEMEATTWTRSVSFRIMST